MMKDDFEEDMFYEEIPACCSGWYRELKGKGGLLDRVNAVEIAIAKLIHEITRLGLH